jgi:hypothetical protein
MPDDKREAPRTCAMGRMQQRGDGRRPARAVGVEEKRKAARRRRRLAVGVARDGRKRAEVTEDRGGTEDLVGNLLGGFLRNTPSDI